MKHQVLLVSALVIAVCFLFVAPVSAVDAQPGHDLFQTPNGTTSHDFSSEPIPADFFGPGSDPFNGTVFLDGAPIGNFGGFNLPSEIDTIVERTGVCTDGVACDIELVALSLVSSAPITVTFNGGQDPENWDVAVSLNPGNPSLGQMTIDDTALTFTSDLDVFPRMTFTKVGGGGGPLDLDPIPTVVLGGGDPSLWSHTPDGVYFQEGLTGPNFYPVEPHIHMGPHPQVNPFAGIPTVSEWGMLVMVLLALAAGTVVFRRFSRQVA